MGMPSTEVTQQLIRSYFIRSHHDGVGLNRLDSVVHSGRSYRQRLPSVARPHDRLSEALNAF
jgi:hypothetical protein